MKEYKVGDKIAAITYAGVQAGTVLYCYLKISSYDKDKLVVQFGMGDIRVLETDVFDSQAFALLEYAQRKQQEGTRLLSEAAALFKQAGVSLSKDAETP